MQTVKYLAQTVTLCNFSLGNMVMCVKPQTSWIRKLLHIYCKAWSLWCRWNNHLLANSRHCPIQFGNVLNNGFLNPQLWINFQYNRIYLLYLSKVMRKKVIGQAKNIVSSRLLLNVVSRDDIASTVLYFQHTSVSHCLLASIFLRILSNFVNTFSCTRKTCVQ